MLGALHAGLGIKGALEHAETLEGLPDGAVLAAAVRESYYVRRGDTGVAAKWRRRMELLQIQQKRTHALKVRQTTQQIECSGHADDLEETLRNLEALQELCEYYPSTLPYLHYARAEYARIRGDYALGLQHARQGLRDIRAGQHPVWPWVAGSEIECMRGLEQLQQARSVGLKHIEEAAAAGLRLMRDHVETHLALVEAELGAFDSAVQRLDRANQYREQLGMRGLNMGWSYEARARVALQMNDRDGFERYLRLCSDHYDRGRGNPALAARRERLLQSARARWNAPISLRDSSSEITSMSQASLTGLCELQPIRQALAALHTREERSHEVLNRLLIAANARTGQLYLVREQGVVLAAASGRHPERTAEAAQVIGRTAESVDTLSEDEAPELAAAGDGTRWLVLTCPRDRALLTVGAVALDVAPKADQPALYQLVRGLSHALIEAGDVVARSS